MNIIRRVYPNKLHLIGQFSSFHTPYAQELTVEKLKEGYPGLEKIIEDEWLTILLTHCNDNCKYNDVTRIVTDMIQSGTLLTERMPLESFPYTTDCSDLENSTYTLSDVLCQLQLLGFKHPLECLPEHKNPINHIDCKGFKTKYERLRKKLKILSTSHKFMIRGARFVIRHKKRIVSTIHNATQEKSHQLSKTVNEMYYLLAPFIGVVPFDGEKYNCMGFKLPLFSKCKCPSSDQVIFCF
jgi:hypothetical protein